VVGFVIAKICNCQIESKTHHKDPRTQRDLGKVKSKDKGVVLRLRREVRASAQGDNASSGHVLCRAGIERESRAKGKVGGIEWRVVLTTHYSYEDEIGDGVGAGGKRFPFCADCKHNYGWKNEN
jgi:hypothetical protein